MKSIHSLKGSAKQLRWKRFTTIASAVLAILGLLTSNISVIIIGILLLYTSLYKKTYMIDDSGITIIYNIIFKTNFAKHPFKAFSNILIDTSFPDATRIGFVKNNVTNYGYFNPNDIDKIKDIIKKHNPDILIQNINLRSKFN